MKKLFKNFTCWTKSIGFGFDLSVSENKSIEFEIEVLKLKPILNFSIHWFTKTDHAGPSLGVDIFGNWASLKFYDHRHWNDDKNQWFEKGEELKMMLDEGRVTQKEYDGYISNSNDGDFRKNL